MADLLDAIRASNIVGAYGEFTGDRGAGRRHFPGYYTELLTEDQALVNQVCEGARPSTLVKGKNTLFYLEYQPRGVPQNGQLCGYVVRELKQDEAPPPPNASPAQPSLPPALPTEPTLPPKPAAPVEQRSFSPAAQWCAAALLAVAAAAAGYLIGQQLTLRTVAQINQNANTESEERLVARLERRSEAQLEAALAKQRKQPFDETVGRSLARDVASQLATPEHSKLLAEAVAAQLVADDRLQPLMMQVMKALLAGDNAKMIAEAVFKFLSQPTWTKALGEAVGKQITLDGVVARAEVDRSLDDFLKTLKQKQVPAIDDNDFKAALMNLRTRLGSKP